MQCSLAPPLPHPAPPASPLISALPFFRLPGLPEAAARGHLNRARHAQSTNPHAPSRPPAGTTLEGILPSDLPQDQVKAALAAATAAGAAPASSSGRPSDDSPIDLDAATPALHITIANGGGACYLPTCGLWARPSGPAARSDVVKACEGWPPVLELFVFRGLVPVSSLGMSDLCALHWLCVCGALQARMGRRRRPQMHHQTAQAQQAVRRVAVRASGARPGTRRSRCSRRAACARAALPRSRGSASLRCAQGGLLPESML